MKLRFSLALILCALSLSATATAAPIIAPGDSEAVNAHMLAHDRQFYTISAYPFGLSLDVHPADQAGVDAINQFLAQSENDDFEAVTGSHLFEVLSQFGEYGDLGFFGGVAVAGTAFRYLTLKKEGAPADVLADARAKVVRAAEAWHVFYVVTGGNGVVARGIRLMKPQDPNDPPLPLVDREIVPLKDDDGNPLPAPKSNGSWREDNSNGVLPDGEWTWVDSCSRDQLIGQILGMTVLYDAMKDDPDIDQALVARMQQDAKGVAQMLMTRRDIGPLEGPVGSGMYDLIIMDADGRPTKYNSINPYSLESMFFEEGDSEYNRFMLMMAIGAIKGLHHVTGDEAIEEYLYKELLAERNFLDMVMAEGAIEYMYKGPNTNFDVPDMTAVALWIALYTEKDPQVGDVLRDYMENKWWRVPDEPYTAALCKQPLWHAMYLTITDKGSDAAVVKELKDLLLAFDLAPYWNPERINCDEDEIAAGECIAIDGVTVLTLKGDDDKGRPLAAEALDPSIRPPSNFDARSNPFRVNGGGGNRLNPGGDLLAAYWMGRYMEQLPAGETHVSPNVRNHMPVGGEVDPPVDTDDDNGGCAGASSLLWLLAAALVLVRRRKG